MSVPTSLPRNRHVDVIIIGAGAAGLMCAATAGYRGRRVLVLDHANKAGKKILMSKGAFWYGYAICGLQFIYAMHNV